MGFGIRALRATLDKIVCKCGFVSPGGGENGESKVIEAQALVAYGVGRRNTLAVESQFFEFRDDALVARKVG